MSLDNYDITADPDNILQDIKNTVYPYDTAQFTSESFESYFEILETKHDIERTFDCLESLRMESVNHKPVDASKLLFVDFLNMILQECVVLTLFSCFASTTSG